LLDYRLALVLGTGMASYGYWELCMLGDRDTSNSGKCGSCVFSLSWIPNQVSMWGPAYSSLYKFPYWQVRRAAIYGNCCVYTIDDRADLVIISNRTD
ncbi:24126_t:CDS:2, partial [Gigaspora rosea]